MDHIAATSKPVFEFLHTLRKRSRQPPQTSLCLGSADFCSCRADKPPSPDPLEPLLMRGWPITGPRVTPTNPPRPMLACFLEGGKVLLDPCVSRWSYVELPQWVTQAEVCDLLLPLSTMRTLRVGCSDPCCACFPWPFHHGE